MQCSLLGVAHSPDRIRAVVTHQQRAVNHDRYTDWTSPHFPIRQDKARQEILILSRRLACLVQGNANHLIAHARIAVPRAMLRSEDVALVLRRKALAVIERKLQRSVVCW